MNRKLVLLVVGVVAIVAIVAVLVVPLLLGALGPPVDVYARPAPLITEEPLDLLPLQIAGFDFITAELSTVVGGGSNALGLYQGGIQISITKFPSGDAAASFLDTVADFSEAAASFASANVGEQHWFTATGGGSSLFGWRKGIWVFLISAPGEELRNQVLEDFPY